MKKQPRETGLPKWEKPAVMDLGGMDSGRGAAGKCEHGNIPEGRQCANGGSPQVDQCKSGNTPPSGSCASGNNGR